MGTLTDTKAPDILEFAHTPEEESVVKKSSKSVGALYFTYNLPLQISFYHPYDSRGNEKKELTGHILNYMPRKECCCDMDFSELFGKTLPTKEELRDFCDSTIIMLRHMIRQWEDFRDGKIDMIYYPNSSDTRHYDDNQHPYADNR